MLSQQTIDRAAKALVAGKAVILPTDTVPGLFALDTPQGEKRIYQLKQREIGKPLARMFGSRKDILSRIRIENHLQTLALERLLPGRVTLVLRSRRADEVTIGVRLPMDASLRALIRQTGPLLATSANISGEEPDGLLTFPSQILERVAQEDELLAGPKRFLASTVVDLTRPRPLILRKGAVSLWTVARRLGKTPHLARPQVLNVLFVCGGNTCRSPLAAAIFKGKCSSRRVNTQSAGLSATPDVPAAAYAQRVTVEFGLSLEDHLSVRVDERLMRWADLVLVMTREHLLRIRREYPEASDRSFLLSGFPAPWPHGRDIEDPLGSDLETYREVAREIQSYLKSICIEITEALKGLD